MGLIPALNCDDPPDPGQCESLFLLGEYLMLAGMEALEPFVVDDDCGESIRGYVSMADPRVAMEDIACGALISPWLVSYGISPSAKATMDSSASGRVPLVYTATWRFEFREACYPLDQGIDQPRPMPLDQLHEVHRHIYAHGAAVFHGVLSAYLTGTLYPSAACPRLTFSNMTPIAPTGVVVGWTFDVTAEM